MRGRREEREGEGASPKYFGLKPPLAVYMYGCLVCRCLIVLENQLRGAVHRRRARA